MERLIKVTINDFKLVFRDNSLLFFIFLPFLNVLVIRYGLPYAISLFEVLNDYVYLILMLISMQGSLAFGFIYSMVVIDEKDTQVAKVYGILPISQIGFVLFRLIAPLFFSAAATFSILLFQPFYEISLFANLVYSILTGLVSPLMVLVVSILSKNKIEGMTWQKLYNIPVSLPVLAFLVPVGFSYLFIIFPTYWAYQGFNNLINGRAFFIQFLIGFLYSLFWIIFVARRFTKTHFV